MKAEADAPRVLKRLLLAGFAAGWLALPPAQAADYPAFAAAPEYAQLPEEERRLWDESVQLEQGFVKMRHVGNDPALRLYVQTVVDRLFPEFKGSLRAEVLRIPRVGAFVTPSGTLYIQESLLGRLSNEAQLAAVLAHEGSHFTLRHAIRDRERKKNMAVAVEALRLVNSVSSARRLLLGSLDPVRHLLGRAAAAIAESLPITSAFGFSSGYETEADDEGFKRYTAAGYDAAQIRLAFALLLKDAQAARGEQLFFYEQGSELKDRVKAAEAYCENTCPVGEVGEAGFSRQASEVRQRMLRAEIDIARFNEIIAHLESVADRRSYPDSAWYYLGEAYLRRNDKGDPERALATLRQAVALPAPMPDTFRALGYLELKQGRFAEAAILLEQYLERAPFAKDQESVRTEIENIKSQQAGL